MRIRINFASKEYLLVRKVYLVLLLALAAGVAVFFYNYHQYQRAAGMQSVLAGRVRMQAKLEAEARKRLSAIKQAVRKEDVAAYEKQAQFANAAIAKRVFSWTAFLNRLEEVVPEGVGLTRISPDFTTLDVDIAGTALGIGQVTEFVDRLTKSPYFEDIPPSFHTAEAVADKDIGKNIQVFSLRIRYRPDCRKGAPEGENKPGPDIKAAPEKKAVKK